MIIALTMFFRISCAWCKSIISYFLCIFFFGSNVLLLGIVVVVGVVVVIIGSSLSTIAICLLYFNSSVFFFWPCPWCVFMIKKITAKSTQHNNRSADELMITENLKSIENYANRFVFLKRVWLSVASFPLFNLFIFIMRHCWYLAGDCNLAFFLNSFI